MSASANRGQGRVPVTLYLELIVKLLGAVLRIKHGFSVRAVDAFSYRAILCSPQVASWDTSAAKNIKQSCDRRGTDSCHCVYQHSKVHTGCSQNASSLYVCTADIEHPTYKVRIPKGMKQNKNTQTTPPPTHIHTNTVLSINSGRLLFQSRFLIWTLADWTQNQNGVPHATFPCK